LDLNSTGEPEEAGTTWGPIVKVCKAKKSLCLLRVMKETSSPCWGSGIVPPIEALSNARKKGKVGGETQHGEIPFMKAASKGGGVP